MKHSPAYILAKQKTKNRFQSHTIKAAAAFLGHNGGLVGGPARAAALTADQTMQIAIHAAKIRWKQPCGCEYCRRR